MTSALLVLLSLAVLGASLALLAASLGLSVLADVLAAASGLSGLAAFVVVAAFTVRRARQLGKAVRP